MRTQLELAPMEDSGGPPLILSVPLPNGQYAQFEVVESPIMAPELAARYPDIATYSGVGLNDPNASLRFSVTGERFHGQIITAGGTVYIDPMADHTDDEYMSYQRRDAQRSDQEPRQCQVEGTNHANSDDEAPFSQQREQSLRAVNSATRQT